jgi:hypothetical protein
VSQNTLHQRRLGRAMRFVGFACIVYWAASSASAVEIQGQLGNSTALPDALAMLYDPITGNQYFGNQDEGYSHYAANDVICDTGASGSLLSCADSTTFGFPTISGATCGDVGAGVSKT